MVTVNEKAPAVARESQRVEATPDVVFSTPGDVASLAGVADGRVNAMPTTRRTFPTLRLSRPLWFAVGTAATVAAVMLSSPWLLAAWLAPDLAILAGGFPMFDGQGRLSPAAVRGYNASHSLVGPAALGLLGLILVPGVLAVAALWLSHIGLDRSLGYGLRAPDGSQRG